MNHPEFTSLRRRVDEAITFHERDQARALAHKGLELAGEKEQMGEVMYFKAQLEIIDARFTEAVAFLDRALEYNPQDGAAYNDLAICMVEMGMIEGVEEFFDKGIEVEPDYAGVYHNKGWFLNKLGRHQEALVLLQKAIDLEPGRAVSYENLADTYENLGRTSEALTAYKEALRLVRPTAVDIRRDILEEITRLEKKVGEGH